MASYYSNKSIAESNSIDLAWKLLYTPDFENLRRALIPTHDEQRRFRQLIVNVVLATDVMDKELKQARNERWEKAFTENAVSDGDLGRQRKATIVIERTFRTQDSCDSPVLSPGLTFSHFSHRLDPGLGRGAYDATLARVLQMERAFLCRVSGSIQTRPSWIQSSRKLVPRGARVFRLLCHSVGQETQGLRCLWRLIR